MRTESRDKITYHLCSLFSVLYSQISALKDALQFPLQPKIRSSLTRRNCPMGNGFWVR